MLEWLTGSTRPADAYCTQTDDGITYIEEQPETPAPLFAVRAFKTAIFGTPHPDERGVRRPTQPVEEERDVAKAQPAEKVGEGQPHDAPYSYFEDPVAVLELDPLASPTKGILLTPGTAATRRKTVSFGTLIADAQKKEEHSPSTKANCDSTLKSRRNLEAPDASSRIQPRHSSLTKTLIELSKQNTTNKEISITSSEQGPMRESASSIGVQTENTDQIADSTVDLSQPCSRSGQHWKTEYEQYHKRSNREMKKIIVYGQNVKSYAVKKDSEATSLGEKLKKELVKVAAMERKVSKLAAQLKNSHAQGPEGESEQTRLVSELAQQTALAIRYKQKADHHRRVMQKEKGADGSDGEGDNRRVMEEADEWSSKEVDSPEVVDQSAQKDTLHAQLETLRMAAKIAEDQAAKLEAENGALKRSLARVKGEMMSYESRRQAREERFKRREAKYKTDQMACQAELAKLTVEHRKLLLASGQPSKAETLARPQPTACYDDLRGLTGNPNPSGSALANDKTTGYEPLGLDRISKSYLSPHKSRLQKSVVDIWTLSSPRDAVDKISPSKEPTELPPSSVRHDIQRTLKEIDQNLIPEQHRGKVSNPEPRLLQANNAHKSPTRTMLQSQPGMSSSIHRTPDRRPTNSPRPAMVDLTSGPAKLEPSGTIVKRIIKPSTATLGRSSSLTSRVGSRTSTMTSARGSALPTERAAAAKARLAARSAEKRKGQESEGQLG